MNRILHSLTYHSKRVLFEYFAVPRVRQMDISKVYFKNYLPKSPVIIDCGAHIGDDSRSLIKFLKGTVHSFEPVEELYARLKQNTSAYKNIFTYKLALSDCNGTSEFYVSEGESDGSSSLLPPLLHLKDHPRTLFRKKIIVETKTLDSWASENNITNIDLLWLDMQGFEMNMLQASNKILDTVKLIHTEVSTRETYKGVGLYNEYKKFLESKGFKVLVEAIPKNWDMGNVLFIK
ncbi:MAG TPA: FkbM family methyltransferase [Chitinophagaceae bacterium]|nr:FkbM family methyltransferase [Chitinophagaceae bacterium]